MLKTVEAEITPDGRITLLEPIEVKERTRALVTVLENGVGPGNGNLSALLHLIEDPEFKNRQGYPAEQIEEQIEESRDSWE